MPPLEDITNGKPKFSMHLNLDSQYASLRSLTSSKILDKNLMESLRSQGKRHIDLWVDGKLYPMDPSTGMEPSFRNLHDLLRFIGDGNQGLLGYCKRLCTHGVGAQSFHLLDRRRMQAEHLAQLGHKTILQMQEQIQLLHDENQRLKANEVEKENELRSLKAIKEELCSQNAKLCKENVGLGTSKKATLTKIQLLEGDVKKLSTRLQSLKNTPLGWKERKREIRPMDSLSLRGGAHKRRVKAIRDFMADVLGGNGKDSCDKLHVMKSVIKNADFISMLRDPSRKGLRRAVTNEVWQDAKEIPDSNEISIACDEAGINRHGYKAIFRILKCALQARSHQSAVSLP